MKKSKSKHNKAKRARKSVIPTSSGDKQESGESDESDDEEGEDDDEGEDEENMAVDDEGDDDDQEEDEVVEKKSKKQKENRPIKKAVRKIKEPNAGDESNAKPTKGAKTDTPPRRVTRSSMKNVK